jgi:DEAD/DEAH box helicase domain-containing protein
MAHPSVVVFDIETSNIFSETGSNDPTKLDISIVGVYDAKKDSYSSYAQEEFGALWPVLERADILVTFNGDHFDIPLLNKYYPGNLHAIKSLDLLVEVKKVLGRRLRLDTLAEATLGTQKSGHGLQATQWWKEGKHDLVRKYCLDDVRITKDLYEYALAHKELFYTDFGEKKTIKLDTKHWRSVENPATLTYTLPF